MGLMRFLMTPSDRLLDETLQQAYLSGFDRAAWPVRTRVEGSELLLDRNVSDSAGANILWPVEGHGLLALSTGTLIEREEPYLLPLELARGTISQLRSQLADWQVIGLAVPEAITEKLAEAVHEFAWAAVTQEDPAASGGRAQKALRVALDASQLLANAYAEQALAARRRSGGKLSSLFGCELAGPPLDEAGRNRLRGRSMRPSCPCLRATSRPTRGISPGPPATLASTGAAPGD